MFNKDLAIKQKTIFLIFGTLIVIILLEVGIIFYSRLLSNEKSSLVNKEAVQEMKSNEGGVKNLEDSTIDTAKGSVKNVESVNTTKARVDSVERVTQ